MTVSGYIPNDGYTESGYVAEVPRLHPAVRFKFRPALSEQRALYVEAADQYKASKLKTVEAALLAKLLVSWDLKDPAGNPAPLDEKGLARVKPLLFNRLFRVALGEEPSDDDPQRTRADDGQGGDLLEAIRTGRTPAAVAEDRDAKNS